MLRAVEETSKQTTDQIRSINKLFLKLQDKIKTNAAKLYNKELLELLFEQPYCKIEFLVDRLNISRVTASKYLNGLEKIGVLQSKFFIGFKILLANTFRCIFNRIYILYCYHFTSIC